MDDPKALSLPNVPEEYFKSADVLLVLSDGTAVLCHSQILALHSAVLRNMLADVPARQSDGRVRVPFPDFTEAQCSALLAYLYNAGLSCKGAAFEDNSAASRDAAVAVARFAHAYDAPHALQHVQVYMAAFLDAFQKNNRWAAMTAETVIRCVVLWAVLADKFDMHELCGRCERALVIKWKTVEDRPDLAGQLSSSALQRVAKGLNRALLAAAGPYNLKYPDAQQFIAWRKGEQPTVHASDGQPSAAQYAQYDDDDDGFDDDDDDEDEDDIDEDDYE